ncbi:MAG: carboxypeptidase-like regulatory domain-containing protein [Acidobacteriota bacterium]
MSHLKTICITIIVILVVGITVCGEHQPHAYVLMGNTKTGILKGRAMDPSEGGISSAKIIVEGDTVKREVITNEAGEYEIELPVGIYRINTDRMPGWLPFRRAAIQVQADTVTTVNVVPVPSIEDSECVLPPPEKPLKDPQLKYKSFLLSHTSGMELELLIQYIERRERKGFVEYSSKIGTWVMVSFDKLAIYADKIDLNEKKFRLKADGRVIIEDGTKRIYAKGVVVDLKASKPIISIDSPSGRPSK